MIKLIGYLLISASVVFLGLSINFATDVIALKIEETNLQIAKVQEEIDKAKQEIPTLANEAGKQAAKGASSQTKQEIKNAAGRALSLDPRKNLDPLGFFD